MKQITEDYVSYEIAKLLKEKGFNEDVTTFYNSNGKFEYCSFPLNHNLDIGSGFVSAPTQSLALKWLREVHNIHIEIRYLPNQFTDEPSYKAMIWDMSEEIGRPLPNDIEFAFYETCVNKALKYTLENLV